MKTAANTYDIHFDENLEAVIMEWNGYATSSQFREGSELMLNILIKNDCSKVLAKLRNMTLIGAEDQNWLASNFLPRAIKFGFRSIAIVKPASYFSKVAVENISSQVNNENLKINFFDNPEEAAECLKVT
jgi:hypothetical protein